MGKGILPTSLAPRRAVTDISARNGCCVTWTLPATYPLPRQRPAIYTSDWKRWSLSSLPMALPRFGIKLIDVDSTDALRHDKESDCAMRRNHELRRRRAGGRTHSALGYAEGRMLKACETLDPAPSPTRLFAMDSESSPGRQTKQTLYLAGAVQGDRRLGARNKRNQEIYSLKYEGYGDRCLSIGCRLPPSRLWSTGSLKSTTSSQQTIGS